jgi:PEP-CTERM motif
MKIRIFSLLTLLLSALLAGASNVSVVASSIQNGDTFSPAPLNLTEVVTFSAPIDACCDASSFSAADFELLDPASHSVSSAYFSFDPTYTILTVNYANLTTPGTYEFEILSATEPPGLPNPEGPLTTPFIVTFYLDHPGIIASPEPSSLLLLASGLLGAVRLRRRLR